MSNLKKYLKVINENVNNKRTFDRYMEVIHANQDFFTRHEIDEFFKKEFESDIMLYDEGMKEIIEKAKKYGKKYGITAALAASLIFSSTAGKLKATPYDGPVNNNVTISAVYGDYSVSDLNLKNLQEVSGGIKKMIEKDYNTTKFLKEFKNDPETDDKTKETLTKSLLRMKGFNKNYEGLINKLDKDYNKLIDTKKMTIKEANSVLNEINRSKKMLEEMKID
jgi:hypothetical protein